MFHRLINEDSQCTVNSAERLSDYILRIVSEFAGDEKISAHRQAILVSYLACRMLQQTYMGEEPLENISKEGERLLIAVAGVAGNA